MESKKRRLMTIPAKYENGGFRPIEIVQYDLPNFRNRRHGNRARRYSQTTRSRL